MKTKNMKKALSLFLAVLMIALALPLTLLSVSAESQPTAVEFTSVALHAQDVNGNSVSFAKSNGGVEAIDNVLHYDRDYAASAEATLAKKAYFESNGEIDFKDSGDYYGIIVVELEQLTTLDTFTVWSPNGLNGKWLDNLSYDIYYSRDGIEFFDSGVEIEDAREEHELVPGASYPFDEVVGDTGATLENSDNPVYMNEMKMENITAKYVAIAVKEPRNDTTKTSIILYEVTAKGTPVDIPENIPVSVAGIQQNANGDFRLVGVTNSMDIASVGFKLNVTYTYPVETPVSIKSVTATVKKGTGDSNLSASSSYPLKYATDGDENLEKYWQTGGTLNDGNEYPKTYYLNDSGKLVRDTSGENRDYHGYVTFELANKSNLKNIVIWLAADEKSEWKSESDWNINNAYDILYSTDGKTWTLDDSLKFDSMCEGNFPSSGDDDYASRVLSDGNTRAGHKIVLNGEKGVEATYFAIAIREAAHNSAKKVVLGDVTVEGTEIENTKTVRHTTNSTAEVYNSIIAAGENVTAKDINSTLYGENDKLYALGVTGIPTTGTVTLKVTPYFIPVGTDVKIYGDAKNFDFVDGKALNKSETVKVMSYNICNGQVGNKVLSTRLDYIAAQINSVDPDVVVLNEARNYGDAGYDIAISSLTEKCDVRYGIVDFVNEKATNVILYNTEKYTLVSSEVITLTNLNENGDDVGDEYERTAVFARLKRISDNREFAVAGIHLDLTHEVAKMQAWEVKYHLADNYGDIRHIVAGDFNFTSPAHDAVNGSNIVHTNPLIKEGYTDVNVGVDSTATKDGSGVIDFIYSKGFDASGYTVVKADNAANASDHYAIYAELTLN